MLSALQWQSGNLAFWETPVIAQPADSSGTPAAPVSDTGSNTQGAGFVDIVLSGGIVGMMILLLLFALSLTASYLVFEHAMTIRQKDLMPEGLRDTVRDYLLAGKVEEAENACIEAPSFLSFVILSGIAELDSGWTGVEKALEDATAEQSARLFRKIEYLSVIGNIAPMVGLLGTVTGMIFAFQQVASTQGAAGAADLAEGIYQALVTTVGGLIIAIPCLGAFAVFRNWIDELVAEAAYQAQQVFTPLKRRRRQASNSGGKSG
ncbi:MAG: peptide transporter TolQ [Blastopirellula sp.]|nr:MAG: peptide transporter TolQ [Blastopirellula sp.]